MATSQQKKEITIQLTEADLAYFPRQKLKSYLEQLCCDFDFQIDNDYVRICPPVGDGEVSLLVKVLYGQVIIQYVEAQGRHNSSIFVDTCEELKSRVGENFTVSIKKNTMVKAYPPYLKIKKIKRITLILLNSI
jgi:hypothetical protein